MQRAHRVSKTSPVTEMAIVDTFTKLIFGDEDFSDRQLMIIEALRSVNPDGLRDGHREMGEYLRYLGVREMIRLVARVRLYIADHGDAPAFASGRSAPGGVAKPADPPRRR